MERMKSIYILFLLLIPCTALYRLSFTTTPTPAAPDFNFNNKEFLKELVKIIIDCIQNTTTSSNTTVLSTEGSPDGKLRAIFKYNGFRSFNESCLGDPYRNDIMRKLHDASCMHVQEKWDLLSSFSCNATEKLECRKVGDEQIRELAQPVTPIMRCLCPHYAKPQTIIDIVQGYYNPDRRICTLRVGQPCKVFPKGHDKRFVWRDVDYPNPQGGLGIDVVDLRPIPSTYSCVSNAFCFTNDSKGLQNRARYQGLCNCDPGYFPDHLGECRLGREPARGKSVLLVGVMFVIGLVAFIGGLKAY